MPRKARTVVCFANRLLLLFDGGAEVGTYVANSVIKWSSYKLDHKHDKVGVFVLIALPKIPFKGAEKRIHW